MLYLLGGWSGRQQRLGRYIDGQATSDMRAVMATVDFATKIGDGMRSWNQIELICEVLTYCIPYRRLHNLRSPREDRKPKRRLAII